MRVTGCSGYDHPGAAASEPVFRVHLMQAFRMSFRKMLSVNSRKQTGCKQSILQAKADLHASIGFSIVFGNGISKVA